MVLLPEAAPYTPEAAEVVEDVWPQTPVAPPVFATPKIAVPAEAVLTPVRVAFVVAPVTYITSFALTVP